MADAYERWRAGVCVVEWAHGGLAGGGHGPRGLGRQRHRAGSNAVLPCSAARVRRQHVQHIGAGAQAHRRAIVHHIQAVHSLPHEAADQEAQRARRLRAQHAASQRVRWRARVNGKHCSHRRSLAVHGAVAGPCRWTPQGRVHDEELAHGQQQLAEDAGAQAARVAGAQVRGQIALAPSNGNTRHTLCVQRPGMGGIRATFSVCSGATTCTRVQTVAGTTLWLCWRT